MVSALVLWCSICALRGPEKGNYLDILKICYRRCKQTIDMLPGRSELGSSPSLVLVSLMRDEFQQETTRTVEMRASLVMKYT